MIGARRSYGLVFVRRALKGHGTGSQRGARRGGAARVAAAVPRCWFEHYHFGEFVCRFVSE